MDEQLARCESWRGLGGFLRMRPSLGGPGMFCEDEAPCEPWEGLGVLGRPRVRWEGGGLCAPLRRSPPFLPAVAGALPPQLIGFSESGPPASGALWAILLLRVLGSPIFERGFEGALRVLAVFFGSPGRGHSGSGCSDKVQLRACARQIHSTVVGLHGHLFEDERT